MKKKICFGIILYDKVEETKLAADIIKSFDKNYYIIACTNNKDVVDSLQYENIDEVKLNEDLPFNRSNWNYFRTEPGLIMRITENIRACNQALTEKEGYDYCAFLHSDSWMLSHEGVLKLIKELENSQKYFAVSGVGFGMMTQNAPLGNILDMLWVYNRKKALESKVFNFDVIEMMPHQLDSHGILAANLLIKVGLKNIYYYHNTGNSYFWKNKYLTEKNNEYKFTTNATPSIYYPEYHFTHVHEGAFPNNLGKELQGYYLRAFNMTKGPTITPFLKNCKLTDKEVFQQIKKVDKKIQKKLLFNGLTYEVLGWGKNFTKIEAFLSKSIFSRFKLFVMSWIRYIVTILITRERYYGHFYGAKIREGLNQFYDKNIHDLKTYEQYGHSTWYKDKRMI